MSSATGEGIANLAYTEKTLRVQYPERRTIVASPLELTTGRNSHSSRSIDQPEVEQCVVAWLANILSCLLHDCANL